MRGGDAALVGFLGLVAVVVILELQHLVQRVGHQYRTVQGVVLGGGAVAERVGFPGLVANLVVLEDVGVALGVLAQDYAVELVVLIGRLVAAAVRQAGAVAHQVDLEDQVAPFRLVAGLQLAQRIVVVRGGVAVGVGLGQHVAVGIVIPGAKLAQLVVAGGTAVQLVVGVADRVAVRLGLAHQVAQPIVAEGRHVAFGVLQVDLAVQLVIAVQRHAQARVNHLDQVAYLVIVAGRDLAVRVDAVDQAVAGVILELGGVAARIRFAGAIAVLVVGVAQAADRAGHRHQAVHRIVAIAGGAAFRVGGGQQVADVVALHGPAAAGGVRRAGAEAQRIVSMGGGAAQAVLFAGHMAHAVVAVGGLAAQRLGAQGQAVGRVIGERGLVAAVIGFPCLVADIVIAHGLAAAIGAGFLHRMVVRRVFPGGAIALFVLFAQLVADFVVGEGADTALGVGAAGDAVQQVDFVGGAVAQCVGLADHLAALVQVHQGRGAERIGDANQVALGIVAVGSGAAACVHRRQQVAGVAIALGDLATVGVVDGDQIALVITAEFGRVLVAVGLFQQLVLDVRALGLDQVAALDRLAAYGFARQVAGRVVREYGLDAARVDFAQHLDVVGRPGHAGGTGAVDDFQRRTERVQLIVGRLAVLVGDGGLGEIADLVVEADRAGWRDHLADHGLRYGERHATVWQIQLQFVRRVLVSGLAAIRVGIADQLVALVEVRGVDLVVETFAAAVAAGLDQVAEVVILEVHCNAGAADGAQQGAFFAPSTACHNCVRIVELEHAAIVGGDRLQQRRRTGLHVVGQRQRVAVAVLHRHQFPLVAFIDKAVVVLRAVLAEEVEIVAVAHQRRVVALGRGQAALGVREEDHVAAVAAADHHVAAAVDVHAGVPVVAPVHAHRTQLAVHARAVGRLEAHGRAAARLGERIWLHRQRAIAHFDTVHQHLPYRQRITALELRTKTGLGAVGQARVGGTDRTERHQEIAGADLARRQRQVKVARLVGFVCEQAALGAHRLAVHAKRLDFQLGHDRGIEAKGGRAVDVAAAVVDFVDFQARRSRVQVGNQARPGRQRHTLGTQLHLRVAVQHELRLIDLAGFERHPARDQRLAFAVDHGSPDHADHGVVFVQVHIDFRGPVLARRHLEFNAQRLFAAIAIV